MVFGAGIKTKHLKLGDTELKRSASPDLFQQR